MATFHAKNGRFTSRRSAHTVTRGGERFKMVRQLRRIGGKKPPEPEPEASDDVVDSVEEAKVKEAMAVFLSASPGWTPLHNVMDAVFGDDGAIAEAKYPTWKRDKSAKQETWIAIGKKVKGRVVRSRSGLWLWTVQAKEDPWGSPRKGRVEQGSADTKNNAMHEVEIAGPRLTAVLAKEG